jgi:hypothetical protein
LHDALSAERRGIPAVAIMTDRFVVTAREMAALQGLPEYPFVVIDHPIAGNPDAELRDKAERVVSSIVASMTVRGSRS